MADNVQTQEGMTHLFSAEVQKHVPFLVKSLLAIFGVDEAILDAPNPRTGLQLLTALQTMDAQQSDFGIVYDFTVYPELGNRQQEVIAMNVMMDLKIGSTFVCLMYEVSKEIKRVYARCEQLNDQDIFEAGFSLECEIFYMLVDVKRAAARDMGISMLMARICAGASLFFDCEVLFEETIFQQLKLNMVSFQETYKQHQKALQSEEEIPATHLKLLSSIGSSSPLH